MGWFYPPAPPQPPQPVKLPVNAVAVTKAAPPTLSSAFRQAVIRSQWKQEDWAAQTMPDSGGQGAPAVLNPPFPLPSVNYVVQANLRSAWPTEQWSSQELIGGGLGGTTAVVIQPQVPLPPINQLITIRAAWPAEQWPAQPSPDSAGALPISQPTIYNPSPPPSNIWNLRLSWPQDNWYAQSEAAVASGIAQIQLPPPYQPNSIADTLAILRSAWPQESWSAQTAVLGAGSILQPVTALPFPVQHFEFRLWPQEQWSAQSLTSKAPGFAITLPPSPYISISQMMNVRMAWPAEAWPAQHGAVIEPLLPQRISAPATTRIMRSAVWFWPQEQWAAQPGTRTEGAFAPVFVKIPPQPIRYDIQKIVTQWPQEQWTTRLAGTSAAALAAPVGPPIPPPIFTLPVTSYGGRVALSPKKLSETAFQTMDFLSRLGVGETIVGAGVTCTVYSGTDSNPAAMVSGPASISGSIVVQAITGGVVGTMYELLFKVQTSAGQVLGLSGYFAVEPDLA